MVEWMLAMVRQQLRISDFDARLAKAHDEPFRITAIPSTLSHYTTLAGLRGILTEQAFRATDHHDVDDKDELKMAEARVDAIIAGLLPTVSDLSSDLFGFFSQYYSERRVASFVTAYLSCFTTVVDGLYHWDNYAGKGGACLVLKCLDEQAPDMYRGCKLGRSARPVDYDPERWDQLIREGFLGVLREYERFVKTAENSNLESKARQMTTVALATVAASAGVFAKNDRYRPEAEWRWVAVPDPDSTPPAERHGNKRYLPLRFRPPGKLFEIEEIVLRGPDVRAARSEVQSILADAGYLTFPSIRVSNHPFPVKPRDEVHLID